MKVYIIAYGSTPWQNGKLIYDESQRQKLDTHIGFVEWPWKHLLRDIQRTKPDWIFLTGSRSFPPEKLKELANIAKLAIWDADAVDATRNKVWDGIRGIPSMIFTVITDLDSTLADQVLWFPQYYDDTYYKPSVPVSAVQTYDIIFLGGLDEKRTEWLEKLRSKYRVMHSQELFGPAMSNMYRQSKISFGIWRDEFKAGDFATSDRIYKSMGAGCFHLLHPVNNVELLFEPEVHLDTYDGSFELLKEQIDYYLANFKVRHRIAEKGRYEILKNHTLTVRLKQYWDAMENYESSTL